MLHVCGDRPHTVYRQGQGWGSLLPAAPGFSGASSGANGSTADGASWLGVYPSCWGAGPLAFTSASTADVNAHKSASNPPASNASRAFAWLSRSDARPTATSNRSIASSRAPAPISSANCSARPTAPSKRDSALRNSATGDSADMTDTPKVGEVPARHATTWDALHGIDLAPSSRQLPPLGRITWIPR